MAKQTKRTQKKYNFNEARIYSTYGSAVRSSNYTVEYSDDNSSWSVAFGGVMSNNTATGLQQGTKTTNNNKIATQKDCHICLR